MSLIRESTAAAYAQAVARLAVFVGGLLIANTLGLRAFAEFSMALIAATSLSAIGLLGSGILLSRHVAKLLSSVGRAGSETQTAAVALLGVSSAVIASVSLALVEPSQWGGQAGWRTVAGSAALGLSVMGIGTGVGVGLRIYPRMALSATIYALFVILASGLAAIVKDARIALAGIGAGALIAAIWTLRHPAARGVVDACWWRIATGGVRGRQILHAVGECLPIIGSVALYSLTILFLGRSVKASGGAEEFAVLAVGFQLFGMAMFFPNVLMRTAIPRLISGGVWKGELASLESKADMGAAMLLVLAVVCYFAGDLILNVYNIRRPTEDLTLVLMMLAAAFATPSNMKSAPLIAQGRQRDWLSLNVLWVLCVGIAYALSRSHFKAAGEAAAMSLATAYLLREAAMRAWMTRSAK